MTESDWLAGRVYIFTDFVALRRRRVTSRKFRLFACACCRQVWPLIGDARSRRAVEVAERFADGLAGRRELAAARASCPGRGEGPSDWAAKAAVMVTASSTRPAVEGVVYASLQAATREGNGAAKEREQTQMLQEIVGNPFHRAVIDSAWLAWNDGTVAKLAAAIYEERRFADLPILADALLEAGCDDETLLAHCRDGNGHVRGCWLLDALLGKQ